MNINGHHYRTIWIKEEDPKVVQIINQQLLPHRFEILDLTSIEDFRRAIKEMYIRGAGLIGAAAGYGTEVNVAVAVHHFAVGTAAAGAVGVQRGVDALVFSLAG